ncbi:TPA: hypothetical protein DEF17_01090 [bacterium]|nr:hypothetical protein [bacterium]
MDGEKRRPFGLLDYWAILKKRWMLALLSFVSVTVTALVYESNRPPIYTAFVDILINPDPPSEQIRNLQPSQRRRLSEMNFDFYIEHARSDACISAVISQGILGAVPPPKTPEWLNLFETILNSSSATRLPERRIIRISVTSGNLEFAYKLANAFGPAYVSSLYESMVSVNKTMLQYIDNEIANTEEETSKYRTIVAYLEKKIGALPSTESPDPGMRTRILNSRNLLRERALAVDAISDTIEAGSLPSLEEMELAVTGLFAAIPDELSRELSGVSRDNLEAARGRWIEKMQRYKLLSRTMTEFHPDRAIAKHELVSASIELINAIAQWYRIADAQIESKLALLPKPVESSAPEIDIYALIGETVVPSQLALSRFKAELAIRESLLTDLIKKKSILNLEKMGQDQIAEWIRPAAKPTVPNNPALHRTLIMGSLLGLMVALAAIFIVESLDSSIKTPGSAESLLGKKVLGIIPCFTDPLSSQAEATSMRMVVKIRPFSPEAEAYRSLAQKIDAQMDKFIVITSTGPQEGKSTTISNLSIALAELGRTVLVISANLRRPTLHKIFEVPEAPGVAELFREEIEFKDAVQETSITGLKIISSGNLNDSSIPAIISSPQLVAKFRDALTDYDFILVDVPPAAPVSDALSFARSADSVLLVYMLGRASEDSVEQVIRSIEDVGGKILGLVMNDVRGIGHAYGYNYSDRYYHYTKEEPII